MRTAIRCGIEDLSSEKSDTKANEFLSNKENRKTLDGTEKPSYYMHKKVNNICCFLGFCVSQKCY